jgi:hypothetical protein
MCVKRYYFDSNVVNVSPAATGQPDTLYFFSFCNTFDGFTYQKDTSLRMLNDRASAKKMVFLSC